MLYDIPDELLIAFRRAFCLAEEAYNNSFRYCELDRDIVHKLKVENERARLCIIDPDCRFHKVNRDE